MFPEVRPAYLEVRPVYLEVRRAYLREVGTFPKPCLRKQGNLKPYLRKGGKFGGRPCAPLTPLQANRTSGRGEIPKPYLRKEGTEISPLPEVRPEYLEVRRKYLRNSGGIKTIPHEA